jgi:hypothetical protein
MSGCGGCNNYNGSYQVPGNSSNVQVVPDLDAAVPAIGNGSGLPTDKLTT